MDGRDIDEILDIPELKPYISPAWMEGSRERMILRKMRNNAVKPIPKDFANELSLSAYLNKEKGWELQGQYYAIIDEWRQWWRGNYAPFHCIKESGLDGNIHTRDMYRLRMPKRACEDWASLLLNDKTTVTVDDKQSAEWLLGDNAQQTGGELGRLDFWHNANTLVELAFRSGTGAFVLGVENLAVIGGIAQNSKEARICMDYLPAECILPLTML